MSLNRIALKLSAVSLSALPLLTLAQVTDGPETGAGALALIRTITNWIAAVFFLVAVIFIIIAAFSYLTAGGDEEKIKGARQRLVIAVVAIIVAALAFFIPRIILDILGIQVQETPATGS